ncbi:MAG: hypothetical protein IIX93_09530 [Clostridia bacterium]|nr:hypothetical protein [Clostridia bacterium]
MKIYPRLCDNQRKRGENDEQKKNYTVYNAFSAWLYETAGAVSIFNGSSFLRRLMDFGGIIIFCMAF